MKALIDAHFEKIVEMSALLFIFIFGCVMLAKYATGDELARWIESGMVITVLARGFGTANKPQETAANVQQDQRPPDSQ